MLDVLENVVVNVAVEILTSHEIFGVYMEFACDFVDLESVFEVFLHYRPVNVTEFFQVRHYKLSFVFSVKQLEHAFVMRYLHNIRVQISLFVSVWSRQSCECEGAFQVFEVVLVPDVQVRVGIY